MGYSLNAMRIEGVPITPDFLQVNLQPEVGDEVFDLGARQLRDFFESCLREYLTPALAEKGREIVTCCLDKGSVEDFADLLPGMDDPRQTA